MQHDITSGLGHGGALIARILYITCKTRLLVHSQRLLAVRSDDAIRECPRMSENVRECQRMSGNKGTRNGYGRTMDSANTDT